RAAASYRSVRSTLADGSAPGRGGGGNVLGLARKCLGANDPYGRSESVGRCLGTAGDGSLRPAAHRRPGTRSPRDRSGGVAPPVAKRRHPPRGVMSGECVNRSEDALEGRPTFLYLSTLVGRAF